MVENGKAPAILTRDFRTGRKMKQSYFLHALTILAATAIVGCGGSSSVGTSQTGNVNYSGTTTVSTTSSLSATVPATGGATINTNYGTAIIPSGATAAGTVIPAGTNLAITPSGFGFNGNFSGGGQVIVNGVNPSGVIVGSNGLTLSNIALPVSNGANGTPNGTAYTIQLPAGTLNTNAPSIKTSGFKPQVLTVQSIIFSGKFYVQIINGSADVVSPVPTNLVGSLPNNGQNAAGSSITATFGPGNAGRSATLFIDYGNGFTLSQTKTISSGETATFSDFAQDTSNVPSTGVNTVSFTIGDLP